MLLITVDVIHVPDEQFIAGRGAVAAVGAMFALAGVSLIVHGIRGLMRGARRARLLVRHAAEPWLADYEWNPTGTSDDTGTRITRMIHFGLAFTGFLVPFNWVFLVRAPHPFAGAIVGLFDCIAVGCRGYTIYLVVRRIKYGRTRLVFDRFPYHFGETLDVRFGSTKGIGSFDRITFTLRCIQERYETRGSGKDRSQQVVCYQVYGDELVMDQPGVYAGGDSAVPLSFALPQDGRLTSQLAQQPPRYWEMENHAETPGVDFKATYLLPIYARPETG